MHTLSVWSYPWWVAIGRAQRPKAAACTCTARSVVALFDVLLTDISLESSGAGIYIGGGEFTMSGGRIQHCMSEHRGGGVNIVGGEVQNTVARFTNVTMHSCEAASSGALGVYGGTLTVLTD